MTNSEQFIDTSNYSNAELEEMGIEPPTMDEVEQARDIVNPCNCKSPLCGCRS